MRCLSMRVALRIALALIVCPCAVHAGVLWKSDFVNKGIEQFSIYDVGPRMNPGFVAYEGPSVWYVKNGALHQDSNIWGDPWSSDGLENPATGTTAVVKDFSAQDGIFFVQFRTEDDDAVSLVFRWQNEGTFLRFMSLRDPVSGGPITRLDKWTNGEFKVLDYSTDVVYQQGVQETMLVVAKGSQIEAYIGDLSRPVLRGTDSDPKPGSFGVALYAESPIHINALEALSPDSNLYIATLKDKAGKPLGGYWASLSTNGTPVAGVYTNPDGQALFRDIPAGTYEIATGGLMIQPVAPQTATVKAGVSAENFSLDVKPTDTVADLSTAAGAAWKIMIPAAASDDYADPAKSDADFQSFEVPSDWDTIEVTHPTYAWLRLRVSIPAAYQGKDLVLTGWNLDDEDWTYWNGKFVGHTNVYNAVRSYVIPGSIVKADNVLAIRGLDTGGAGGITQSAPKLVLANPSVSIAGTVTDQNGKPVAGVEITAFSPVTAWGPQTVSATTAADGSYFIGGLAPGTYTITRSPRLDLDPADGESVSKSGEAGQTLTANFTVFARPTMDLSSAAGIKWLALYPANPGDLRPAAPDFAETGLVEVPVPGRLENEGLGDEYSLFWYRAHITLPDSFKAFKGRDLILTGFNIDDADVTYFNGKEVGRTGNLPTNPDDPTGTGYIGDAFAIRTYTIPADLVNWDGDNVLAINGYENTGDSGMTSAGPVLIVAPGPALPPVVRGDVNGDGKVGVPDATMALRFAVGIEKPNDQQLAAGDVNGNGKIDIPDVTLILRAAVGLGKL